MMQIRATLWRAIDRALVLLSLLTFPFVWIVHRFMEDGRSWLNLWACWKDAWIEAGTPRCDVCGRKVTTGFMAVFCNRVERCEFWPDDELGADFIRQLRTRTSD